MKDYKDASQVTENVLSQLYGKQSKDRQLRFLLSLFMRLTEEQQDDFLRVATTRAKSKDKYYLWQLKSRSNRK